MQSRKSEQSNETIFIKFMWQINLIEKIYLLYPLQTDVLHGISWRWNLFGEFGRWQPRVHTWTIFPDVSSICHSSELWDCTRLTCFNKFITMPIIPNNLCIFFSFLHIIYEFMHINHPIPSILLKWNWSKYELWNPFYHLDWIRYIAPSVLLGYLYFHTARDLRPPEGELSVMMYEQRADIVAHRHER